MPKKSEIIAVQGIDVTVAKNNIGDYISLTNMIKAG